VAIAPTPEGKPWYTWDPPLVERDATTGKVTRLVETGYTWWKPPEVQVAHQQGYIRSSTDEGKTWSEAVKVPEWQAISEVALLRAANGDLVAACRTDMPRRMEGDIDHAEGLGVSISKDNGRTWSAVEWLYEWGRHHPAMILMPNGDIVMTYVVRRGYTADKDGFPRFGIEAITSRDHGRTWDLDHRYILHSWTGKRKGDDTYWWPSSQATSSVLFADGSILTAFGTGYRVDTQATYPPSPRDVGLIQWRLNPEAVNDDRTIRDAAFDSDRRNVFNP
jgi:Neuraminidase (sialidase)